MRGIIPKIGPLAIALIGLLLNAPVIFAHRPYNVPEGTFLRRDGVVITVQQHFGDGIVLRDPGRVQFLTPGGDIIAQTEFVAIEQIVCIDQDVVNVFEYPSSLFPVSSRSYHFDGYKLIDNAVPAKISSIAIHTRKHLKHYALTISAGSSIILLALIARILPKGPIAVTGGVLAAAYGLFVGLFTLLYLIIFDISPIFWAVGIAIISSALIKLFQRYCMKRFMKRS